MMKWKLNENPNHISIALTVCHCPKWVSVCLKIEETHKKQCNCEIGLTNLFQLLKVARLFVARYPLPHITGSCVSMALSENVSNILPLRA